MKKSIFFILGISLLAFSACKKYLDVNTNPNGPSQADPALYLPSIEANYAQGVQFDSRLIGPYSQNFLTSAISSFQDTHGYASGSDFGGSLWRNVYWKGGFNTRDMIRNAMAQKKWDIVGVGYALEAWGWQMLTDYHGPIISIAQVYDSSRNTFDYDPQDTIYAVVKRECLQAIDQLNQSSDGVGSPLFIKFDQIYKGDRAKWRKFVYATLAINAHHLIKKSFYKPDDVISFVDQSFSSNADDAIVPFAGTIVDDANIFGPLNQNMGVYGQSGFIVRLTDGTIFGIKDPRQTIMLNPSTDGLYRGLSPGSGQSSIVSASATGVKSLWGTTLGTNITAAGTQGKYFFQDKAGFPLMTYAELQFIKAEAAFTKGDKAMALSAYINGVNASLDATIRPEYLPNSSAIAAYNTQRTLYLASPLVIPTSAATLTIKQILLQKYIALWGWGFIETWTDLRKYDYDANIFTSFTLPATFFVDNNNKPAYRVRPRYNSEYLWNVDALRAIGGYDLDYHTRKMWIQLP